MREVKRPTTLIYGVEDAPPLPVTFFNALQHVGLIAITLVYPLLLLRAVGASVEATSSVLSIGMFVLGIGTLLQSLRLGPIGSGYMCPASFTATYLAPSLLAARLGGLPLVFGMTLFAGAVEVAIAPLLHRLRAIFPPEISGVIVLMIGISAAMGGLRAATGASAEPIAPAEWWVAGIALAGMIGLNVWGSGLPRMLCALIGLALGYLAAGISGLLGASLTMIDQVPWVGLPDWKGLAWSFDPWLAIPFAIASIATAMKAAGTITVAQRINDAGWVRPGMYGITRGVLSDGLASALAGAVGTFGVNTATPSVGLSSATGVASRQVALAVGAMLMLLGFFPKLTALFAVMPRAVVAAALLFTVTFIIVNGLQIMTSRLLDTRRTLVVGLSLTAGVAVEAFPGVTAYLPEELAPIFSSSLVFSTVVALVLNLLFRIGVRQTADLTLAASEDDHQKVQDFFARQTAIWGTRPDVASRAAFGVIQLVDTIRQDFWTGGAMLINASFDEFNLEVHLAYRGEVPEFPEERPTAEQIRESEQGARLLAGFLLRRNADRVRAEWNDGTANVYFHFDH
jgi:NCS2 family nucleobase:cation symporter-2